MLVGAVAQGRMLRRHIGQRRDAPVERMGGVEVVGRVGGVGAEEVVVEVGTVMLFELVELTTELSALVVVAAEQALRVSTAPAAREVM